MKSPVCRDRTQPRTGELLGALVEREVDDFEGLCLAAQIDVQWRAGLWSPLARRVRQVTDSVGCGLRPGAPDRTFHACCSFLALTHAFEKPGSAVPSWSGHRPGG